MVDNERHASSAASGLSLTTTVIGALLAFALIISLALLTEEVYELDEHLQAQLSASRAMDADAPVSAQLSAQGFAVYVPAYGPILSSSEQRPAVETLLSIRNTDLATSLRIDAIRAFDRQGHPVATLLDSPQALGPLQSLQLPRKTSSSRTPATSNEIDSFMVEWSADGAIDRPLIEALVIGEAGTLLVSRGKAIERRTAIQP